jgi:hypothetical protein
MIKEFYLIGSDIRKTSRTVDVDYTDDVDALKRSAASEFNIVEPEGISFENKENGQLIDIEAVLDSDEPIGILVDGHQVREPVCITVLKLEEL